MKKCGDAVKPHGKWTLKHKNGTVEEFIDIRRKVGNRIIRAHLIRHFIEQERYTKIHASLRGPKDEFKDFARFFILEAQWQESPLRLLVEYGVYENLRIVGTDTESLLEKEANEIINMFTEIVRASDKYGARLIINEDSILIGE